MYHTSKKLYNWALLLFLNYSFFACNSFAPQKQASQYYTPISKEDSVFIATLSDKSNKAGTPDSTFYYLKEIINYAKQKNSDKLLYNAYANIAQKYANTGNKELWNVYFDSASQIAAVTALKEIKVMFSILEAKINKRQDSTAYYIENALKDSAWLSPRDIFDIHGFLSFAFMQKKYYPQARKYTELALGQINNMISDPYGRSFNTSVLHYNLYQIELNEKDTPSAIQNLKYAAQITDKELKGNGYPLIYEQIGKVYLQQGLIDSAKFYFSKFNFLIKNETSDEATDYSRLLNAEVLFAEKNYTKALQELQLITTSNPGSYFAGDGSHHYFNLKYRLHKITGNTNAALAALEQKAHIDSLNYIEDKKTQLGELEEKLIAARAENTIMEKEQKLKKQRLYILFLITGLVLAGIMGILGVVSRSRKKTIEKQQKAMLEQQAAVAQQKILIRAEKEERSRIAQEIHDNIGPAITTLNLAGNMLSQATTPVNYTKISGIILQNTQKLGSQINEIIWSLNSSNDSLPSLVAFTKKFADQFLETTNIKLTFDTNIEQKDTMIVGYKRRLIYASIKEVLNNAVKYAKASIINITINEKQDLLSIIIKDDGIGLTTKENIGHGYGLQNIQQNIKKIGGNAAFINDNGLKVELLIPL